MQEAPHVLAPLAIVPFGSSDWIFRMQRWILFWSSLQAIET
jgi:hypothetical protein